MRGRSSDASHPGTLARLPKRRGGHSQAPSAGSHVCRGNSVHGRAPNCANADCPAPRNTGCPARPLSYSRIPADAQQSWLCPPAVTTRVPTPPPVAEGCGPLPWLPAQRAEEETGGQAGGRQDQHECLSQGCPRRRLLIRAALFCGPPPELSPVLVPSSPAGAFGEPKTNNDVTCEQGNVAFFFPIHSCYF